MSNTHCPNCGADLTAIIDAINERMSYDEVVHIEFLGAVCEACGADLPNVKA